MSIDYNQSIREQSFYFKYQKAALFRLVKSTNKNFKGRNFFCFIFEENKIINDHYEALLILHISRDNNQLIMLYCRDEFSLLIGTIWFDLILRGLVFFIRKISDFRNNFKFSTNSDYQMIDNLMKIHSRIMRLLFEFQCFYYLFVFFLSFNIRYFSLVIF